MRGFLLVLAAVTASALAACGGTLPAAHVGPAPASAGDAELASSFALAQRPSDAKRAPTPSSIRARDAATATEQIAPGAPSDAEVRRELHAMRRALRGERQALHTAAQFATLAPGGLASAPAGAPRAVALVVAAGNAIARFPYVYGGGHRSFVDSAYDCSGSVSYALAAGGMLDAPEASGALARWGAPGPGRWISVYANGGHVFMVVGGLRFDTSGRDGAYGSRWQAASRGTAGFAVRHWPGL